MCLLYCVSADLCSSNTGQLYILGQHLTFCLQTLSRAPDVWTVAWEDSVGEETPVDAVLGAASWQGLLTSMGWEDWTSGCLHVHPGSPKLLVVSLWAHRTTWGPGVQAGDGWNDHAEFTWPLGTSSS
ncbi:unnamed protein product [Rangifer tarandus platyrhynchus]|uniref:Uncharacterized protein n=2 Tax=Rangifer tarandus platyrhynchus TaxID=3082113 RepID=A0ABN8ZL98_RANTA|nr:unnamed protein product [Rangifer tarandus platyrhynchus]CAI9708241.1 unnamed protein product [Rangifer tarandus platyrhynchus]